MSADLEIRPATPPSPAAEYLRVDTTSADRAEDHGMATPTAKSAGSAGHHVARACPPISATLRVLSAPYAARHPEADLAGHDPAPGARATWRSQAGWLSGLRSGPLRSQARAAVNFVTPAVRGRSIHLNPVAIHIAVVADRWIGRIDGHFRAVPLLLVVQSAAENRNSLKPIRGPLERQSGRRSPRRTSA